MPLRRMLCAFFVLFAAVALQAAAQSKAPADPQLDAQVKALRERLKNTASGTERYEILREIADRLHRAERVAQAMAVEGEIVDDRAIAPGRRSLQATTLATRYAQAHNPARSRRYLDRAKELAGEANDAELETLPREPAYAFLTAEAEIARMHEDRHDAALERTRQKAALAWSNLKNPALSEARRRAAANELLGNVYLHVLLLIYNNRRAEALAYAQEMQERATNDPDLSKVRAHRANLLCALALARASQDDYPGALAAVNAGIERFAAANIPEHDFNFGVARRLRVMILLALGRVGELAPDMEILDRARVVNPILAGTVSRHEWESLSQAARGDWASAAASIGESMDNIARRSGVQSPFYKYQSAMRLLYRFNDPASPVTLGEVERYVTTVTGTDADWAEGSYRGAYVEDGALAAALEWLMANAGGADGPQRLALAFRIAEMMQIGSSQGVLADGAARLAAGDPALRALIEQEQRERFERNTGRRAFAVEAERAERFARQKEGDAIVQQRQAALVEEKAKALRAEDEKLAALQRRIADQFPMYRELVNPALPDAARIGAALKPGEAYLSVHVGQRASYLFVVQPGGRLTGQRVTLAYEEARKQVAALRRTFDAASPPARPGDAGGFDFAASHALFSALIAPMQASLADARTVYIAGGGVLTNLPWNALVTQPASSLESASWWIKSAIPVRIPGASALVLTLRQESSRGKRAFAAYADPSFDGQPHPVASAKNSVRARSVAAKADAFDYRAIPRLPETYDEARAIAAAVGAGEGDIRRDLQASRSRVMADSLADARVVAFATHGLLAGEIPGLAKPGIALAYEGRGLEDSVLTIDDIVGLRLDANWVVLSACNTGVASPQAGESMSALLRGFFAAGARMLLATQWAVESESAKQLVVAAFKAYVDDPGASRAEALARAQRAMLEGRNGALYRHPYFWAAYFASGNARR